MATVARCKICEKDVKIGQSKSTSHLTEHARNKHPDQPLTWPLGHKTKTNLLTTENLGEDQESLPVKAKKRKQGSVTGKRVARKEKNAEATKAPSDVSNALSAETATEDRGELVNAPAHYNSQACKHIIVNKK